MAINLNDLVNLDRLAVFLAQIKLLLTGKVDKENGKGLSSNDYTSDEKTKLSGVAAGAQVNVLEGIQKNGATVSPVNKIVNLAIPTKTSDITNDSGFITEADIPEGAAASTATPLMDGTAAVGSSNAFARGDHRHPSDTSKVDKVAGKGLSTEDYTTTEKTKLGGIAAGAQVNVLEGIKVNGTAQAPTDKIVNIAVPVVYDGDAEAGSPHKGSMAYVPIYYFNAVIENSEQTIGGMIATKANASDVYTKTEVDQKLVGAMNYKGTVAAVVNLPSSGNATGDVYHVTADGAEYAWNGSAWEELGTAIDLSGYVEESDITLATDAQVIALFTE